MVHASHVFQGCHVVTGTHRKPLVVAPRTSIRVDLSTPCLGQGWSQAVKCPRLGDQTCCNERPAAASDVSSDARQSKSRESREASRPGRPPVRSARAVVQSPPHKAEKCASHTPAEHDW
ncbi:hypothetical protein E2C01_021872 [Portunus trituberculatus]|uniref:Uncharacterized protein n=1 Tax=Portunus trituberculatus TaxID=210409 RepID=A0A5B7E3Q8_PORTR|nr:hypothetical protein [Portunus trituberculatus]